MASVAECEHAFAALAERLATADPEERRRKALERTLSCTLPDLGVIFRGRLHDGLLSDIEQAEDSAAQIRLTLSSDDLVRLVDGQLAMASAWSSGRLKIGARVMDLIKLRTIF